MLPFFVWFSFNPTGVLNLEDFPFTYIAVATEGSSKVSSAFFKETSISSKSFPMELIFSGPKSFLINAFFNNLSMVTSDDVALN